MKFTKKVLISLFIITMLVNISIVNSKTTKISFQIKEIGSLNTLDRAIDVVAVGDTAFVLDRSGTDHCGLVIVDINDPENPSIISSISDGGAPFKLAFKENYVFVADGPDGLEVFDVSDLEHPVEVDQYPASYYCTDFEIVQDVLYLALWSEGLVMLNISDPTDIQYIGSYTDYGINCIHIAIENNLLCLVDHRTDYNRLIFLDISNPVSPFYLGSKVEALVDHWDPVIENNTLYAGNHHSDAGELRIYNITQPSNIQLLSIFNENSEIFSVTVVNETTLFVGDYANGFIILDVSNPANPELIGEYEDRDGGHCARVILHNGLILSADRDSGLEILTFDITTKVVGNALLLISTVAGIILSIYLITRKRKSFTN